MSRWPVEGERYVVQGPEQSGWAGPWSVWDQMSSTWCGTHYTDDPIASNLPTENQANNLIRLLNAGERDCRIKGRLDKFISEIQKDL